MSGRIQKPLRRLRASSSGLSATVASWLLAASWEDHKRETAATLRLHVFVKDGRRTAEALVTLPLTVFLLDRPWNEGPARSGVYRVRNWDEIVSRLASIFGTVPI